MIRVHMLIISMILLASLFLVIGCSDDAGIQSPDTAAVMGMTEAVGSTPTDEELAVLMEVFGFDEETLAAMSKEERFSLLSELEIAMGGESAAETMAEAAGKGPMLSDVGDSGSYVVTVGDSMLWNYLELYYTDGKLQKIVMHFQKSGEEEPDVSVLEGDEAREFSFYRIDFNADPASVVQQLEDKVGYTYVNISTQ